MDVIMARVSVDADFMVDLIEFKLRHLKNEIEKILSKWDYISFSKFLKDSKDGTLCEAEEDAIILKNIQDQIESLAQKRKEIAI